MSGLAAAVTDETKKYWTTRREGGLFPIIPPSKMWFQSTWRAGTHCSSGTTSLEAPSAEGSSQTRKQGVSGGQDRRGRVVAGFSRRPCVGARAR